MLLYPPTIVLFRPLATCEDEKRLVCPTAWFGGTRPGPYAFARTRAAGAVGTVVTPRRGRFPPFFETMDQNPGICAKTDANRGLVCCWEIPLA